MHLSSIAPTLRRVCRPWIATLLCLLLVFGAPLSRAIGAALGPTTLYPVTITGVAYGNGSVHIDWNPVPGAKDYRVFDIDNPTYVKYAGQGNIWMSGGLGLSAPETLIYPYSNGQSPYGTIDGGWMPALEMNFPLPDDSTPHRLVVQALDALGPMPPATTYTYSPTIHTMTPVSATANPQFGANEGWTSPTNNWATADWSVNGQGPSNSNPNVIAQSAILTVQGNASYAPVPSSSSAQGAWYNSFNDGSFFPYATSGGATLTPATLGPPDSNGDRSQVLDEWTPLSSTITIHDWGGSSGVFLRDGELQTLLDSSQSDAHSSGDGASAVMIPGQTEDLGGGSRMIHVTGQVDIHGGSGARTEGVRIFGAGDTSMSGPHLIMNFGDPGDDWCTGQNYCQVDLSYVNSGIYSSCTADGELPEATLSEYARPTGLLTRFDLFATKTRAVLYVEGYKVLDWTLSNDCSAAATARYSSLMSGTVGVAFVHEITDPHTLSSREDSTDTYLSRMTATDERHWDDLGFETLPASADMPSAIVRPYDSACPPGWICDDIDNGLDQGLDGPGDQRLANGVWTITDANDGGSGDPYVRLNSGRLVAQELPGDGSFTARLTLWTSTHAETYGGLIVRKSTDPSSPYHALSVGNSMDGYHLEDDGYMGGSETGGGWYGPGGNPVPIWLRITRVGTTLTNYWSTDGVTWNEGGSEDRPDLAGPVLVGFTSSQSEAGYAESTNGQRGAMIFDNVQEVGTTSIGTPTYSTPPQDYTGAYLCPSPDRSVAEGVSPSNPPAYAYGQTVAENNPFDPIHDPTSSGSPPASCQPGGYKNWSSVSPAPPPAPWINPAMPWEAYNLCSGRCADASDGSNQPNYRIYNGRWVWLLVQVPRDYQTGTVCTSPGVPAGCNPHPWWWYVQYKTLGTGSFTDRTTWEMSILSQPPHLVG